MYGQGQVSFSSCDPLDNCLKALGPCSSFIWFAVGFPKVYWIAPLRLEWDKNAETAKENVELGPFCLFQCKWKECNSRILMKRSIKIWVSEDCFLKTFYEWATIPWGLNFPLWICWGTSSSLGFTGFFSSTLFIYLFVSFLARTCALCTCPVYWGCAPFL